MPLLYGLINGVINMLQNIADLDSGNGKTYREINNEIKHKFEVGQLVELDDGVRLFVAQQTRDCDGTPLYCLTPKNGDYDQRREGFANYNWVNGYPCDSLKAV